MCVCLCVCVSIHLSQGMNVAEIMITVLNEEGGFGVDHLLSLKQIMSQRAKA